jgi:hypothetical protein
MVAVLLQVGNHGAQFGHQGVRCGAGFNPGFRLISFYGV